MNLSTNFYKKFIISVTAFCAPIAVTARASDANTTKKHETSPLHKDPEPSRGTGMMIGGIVVTSVGVPVGLMVSWLSNWNHCSPGPKPDSEAVQRQHKCVRDRENGQRLGAAISLASVAIGVPLIVFGKMKRNAWKRWNGATTGAIETKPSDIYDLKELMLQVPGTIKHKLMTLKNTHVDGKMAANLVKLYEEQLKSGQLDKIQLKNKEAKK